MHLVLVDDEPAILDVLAAACAADGHTVTTFTSSYEALNYLTTNRVDLLITDIVMPPPDGFRLVSAARKVQPHLGAILVTGYSSRYSLEDVLACGASDLLFKPFRLQELRARVRLAEERQRTTRPVTPATPAPVVTPPVSTGGGDLSREADELRAALGLAKRR
jgi:DNA-binding response OmpR family regulator